MKIIKDVKIKTKICTACNNYTGVEAIPTIHVLGL